MLHFIDRLLFSALFRCGDVFRGQCILWVSTLHCLGTCLKVGAEFSGYSVTLFIQQAGVNGCLCTAFINTSAQITLQC